MRIRATKQILGAKRLLTLLWLIAITARYLDTVRNALLHPFNKGADLDWAWILLAVISAQITSIALWRMRALWVWMGVGTVVAAALVFRSGSAPAVPCAIFVLLAAACWGSWLLKRVGPQKLYGTEATVISFSLGVIFLAFAGLGLALIGVLTAAGVWLLLGISILFHGRTALSIVQRSIGVVRTFDCDREDAILLAMMGLVFILNLIWALMPEIQFDANNYHLAVARMYIEKGHIVDLPNFFHSYFSRLFDLPIALCLATGGPIAAKLLLLVTGLFAAAATYSLGVMLFGHKAGIRSSALLYSTAVVGWLSGTAYVDNALMLFLAVSILAFLHWQETGDRAWLAITALLIGGSAGIKPQAVYVIPGMVGAELWRGWRHMDRRRLYSYAAAVMVALAIAAPWYGIVYGFTANPVFPLYNRIFNSPLWSPENTTLNATEFGIGTSVGALLRLPFRMTFNTERFGEGSPRGSAGIGYFIVRAFRHRYGVPGPPNAAVTSDLGIGVCYLGFHVPIRPLLRRDFAADFVPWCGGLLGTPAAHDSDGCSNRDQPGSVLECPGTFPCFYGAGHGNANVISHAGASGLPEFFGLEQASKTGRKNSRSRNGADSVLSE